MSVYYQDDRMTLHLGDALEVMHALDPESIDAIVMDPPCSSGGRRENTRSLRKSMTRSVEDVDWIAGDAMSTPGFVWMMREVGIEARRVLKPGGHLLAFIDWRMAGNLGAALESTDLRMHPLLVWNKTVLGMGAIFRNQHEFIVHVSNGNPSPPHRRDVPNVLSFPPVRNGDHPTQKPVDLMRALVTAVCPEGGVVLDPFMGSGTTGVAAVQDRRRFVGAELADHYIELARYRIGVAAGQALPRGEQAALDILGLEEIA